MKPLPTRSGPKEMNNNPTDANRSLAMALEEAITLTTQISAREPVSLSRITKLTFRNAAPSEPGPPEAPPSPQLPINRKPLHTMPHNVYTQLDQLIIQVCFTRNGIMDASAAATMKLTKFYLAAKTAAQDNRDIVWAKELQAEVAVMNGMVNEDSVALDRLERMRERLLQRWKAVTEKECVAEPDVWAQDLNEGALREPFGME
ncbi:hypothetical protein P167DRAFT_536163 [Morchella conica CCBAS932]|uniref:Uncharacterized protein n=1 Tax=Morchella conica CCBAS932 TaxID=1392247 RepID=A0A3N4KRJ1_9PEZI|nr:hypothetical protein P167DRAFT_536163 [Morchella conica CCBAS932]